MIVPAGDVSGLADGSASGGTDAVSLGFAVGFSCDTRLLLLLLCLKNPPSLPRSPDSPSTPDLAESLDFLRLRAKPALNLSTGDGLASRLRLAEEFATGRPEPGGSMICGKEDDD